MKIPQRSTSSVVSVFPPPAHRPEKASRERVQLSLALEILKYLLSFAFLSSPDPLKVNMYQILLAKKWRCRYVLIVQDKESCCACYLSKRRKIAVKYRDATFFMQSG